MVRALRLPVMGGIRGIVATAKAIQKEQPAVAYYCELPQLELEAHELEAPHMMGCLVVQAKCGLCKKQ